MKNTRRILSFTLIVVTLFMLVSCSTFGNVKKNFEQNGYTYIELDEDNSYVKTITAELEQGELSCTLHLFSKNGTILLPTLALVLEFNTDKDLQKAISEDGSETLKGFLKDAQTSDFVNGNCLLFPLSLNKNDINEMVEIFNK